MGQQDQQAFLQAVAAVESSLLRDYAPTVGPLSRLAMFDMLPALAAVSPLTRAAVVAASARLMSGISVQRIRFAEHVVTWGEISDFGIEKEQVNDGREYLGCTRLNDAEVQKIIDAALSEAKARIDRRAPDTDYARGALMANQCCGVVRVAWSPVLVDQRRAYANASLNSDIAAAAHYMLSRFHVCAARAKEWEMNAIIRGYDDQKRRVIRGGDRNLSSMAIDKNNRPFPPDFEVQAWAFRGSKDGEADRLRCNRATEFPLFPEVDRKSY